MQNLFAIHWPTFPRDFPVTFVLGAINIGLFLLAKVGLIQPLVSIPDILNAGTFGAHFFHLDLWHLATNLLILLIVGRLLEPVLRKWLSLVVLSVWLLTIGLLWLVNDTPVLGFSGIAMGLLSFALLYFRQNTVLYPILWPMVLVNVLFGLLPGISWWGHLGGAIAGGLVFVVWKGLRR